MFCPRCGSSQANFWNWSKPAISELKFCKACGANLYAVRQVVDARETDGKFDWSKTWVAEMFMSGSEAQRRQLEIQRLRGITPATRRYQEIKAGIITSSVGVSLAIFLSIFMEGIIRSGRVSAAAAEIISHLWVVGVIPIFVGIALMINGYFVSKKIIELTEQNEQHGLDRANNETDPRALRSADTNEFASSNFSVTEGTTQHLGSSKR